MELDHVDRILKVWEQREPGLDMTPIEVAARLLRAAEHLERLIENALAPHGLTFADFDVLNALRREGDERGINPKLLASYALITSGAMTARLDRLERRGLIERHPDPSDRRAILVRLTPEGDRLARRGLEAVLETDRRFLTPLDDKEHAAMADGLRALLIRYESR